MNTSADCPSLHDDETARQWVANTLSPGATAAFEEHLLTCAVCHAAVERATALRVSLRRVAPSRSAGRRVRWALPLGLAAGLGLLLLWPRNPLRQLDDPGPAPTFVGEAIRATGQPAGATDRGMAAYQAGNYAAAAAALDSALAMEPTAGVRFFLAVSRFETGRFAEAATLLAVVSADSASPYAPEAMLWLAKAQLRLRQPQPAIVTLRALQRRAEVPALSRHAGALADSIEEVIRR